MDLNLVMEVLRPKENVSPDMSSYDAMVAKWRGSGNPPSLQDVLTVQSQIDVEQAAVKYTPVEVPRKLTANISTVSMVEALWKFVVEVDPIEKNKIQAIRNKVLKP